MNLVPYVAVGSLLGGLVAVLLGLRGSAPWDEALLVGLPLGFVLGALCLAARYPARAVPLAPGRLLRVGLTHLSAAAFSVGAWMAAGFAWARLLDRVWRVPGLAGRFATEAPVLAVTAFLIFLLAVTAHYLLIALQAAGEAEVRGVQARVLARESELRALRAQIDPHFLFNCLNSVAALTGEDPGAARRMCLQLAGFLRRSLALGRREEISLGEEMGLLADYLAIEKIRFGPRLEIAGAVEEACRGCPVPPLLLQPLAENAVRHGIARMVEGGTLRIDGRRRPHGVELTVENPRDAEEPGGRGAGLGMEIVRGRLRARHGDRAAVDITESPGAYRVRLFIPWEGRPTGTGDAGLPAEAADDGA